MVIDKVFYGYEFVDQHGDRVIVGELIDLADAVGCRLDRRSGQFSGSSYIDYFLKTPEGKINLKGATNYAPKP